jgi:hypothetical protein
VVVVAGTREIVPDVVMVPPVNPAPVPTEVTVPEEMAEITPVGETEMVIPSGTTPPRLIGVAGTKEMVPVVTIGPPVKPTPVPTEVTVPGPGGFPPPVAVTIVYPTKEVPGSGGLAKVTDEDPAGMV